MAGEWPRTPLSDLTDPDTPVTYGVVKPGPEDTEGVLFIRGGDIAGGRVLTEQLRTITRAVSRQYQRTLLRGGEIVVSLVGNPGQVAIVPESLKGANIARQAGLVRLRADVDTRFVKYFLSSRAGQEALGAHSLGSVQQVINLRDLKTIRVPTPPLPEQRAIAHILGTLDDKIELNRRMSETLEAMARALFKSWFVDFDPVRAKAEGRDPGLPQPLADLFPDRFEDSELGEIPKGWRTSRLGDVLELKRGYDLPSVQRRPGEVPIVSSSGPCGTHNEAKAHAPGIVTGRYGTIGEVFFVREDFWPLNTALYVRDFKGTNALYAYYLLQSVEFGKFSDKAAVPGINRNHLHEERLVTALPAVQGRFGKLAGTWLDRKANSERQAKTLAEIRDTLLPKLASGDLRVKDAERFISAVTA